jgi:photosystem II stability/assembly factor-like uncharacterized protein
MQKWCYFIVFLLAISACTATPANLSPTQSISAPTTYTITPPPAEFTQTTQSATTDSPTPSCVQSSLPTATPLSTINSNDAPIQRLQNADSAGLDFIQMLDYMNGWGTTGRSFQDAHILKTSDGGRTWQDVTPNEPASTPDEDGKHVLAFFKDQEHAWAVFWTTNKDLGPVFNPQTWFTVDGGVRWQLSAPFDASPWAGGYAIPAYLDFVDLNNGFLALSHDPGAGQAPVSIYRTQDGGSNWDLQRDPADQSDSYLDACCQTGMAFIDPLNGVVTKDPGPVARTYLVWTHDGGVTWQNQEPPPADQALFESGLCGTTSPVAAIPTGMLRMVVSCLQGAQPGSPPHAYLYTSLDAGVSWTHTRLPDPPWNQKAWPYLRRADQIIFNNPEQGWLFTVATQENPDQAISEVRSYLYSTSNGGKNWQLTGDLEGAGQFTFPNRQNGWGLLQSDSNNSLLITSDGGARWEPIDPLITDQPSIGSVQNTIPIAHLQSDQAFELDAIKMIDAETGWAITQTGAADGHILYTKDGGSTWQDVTPPEIAAGAAASPKRPSAFFLDAKHAWVTFYPANENADKPALVWQTEDGGQSWQAGDSLTPGELEGVFSPGYIFFIDPSQGWLLLEHGAAAGSQPVTLYHTQDGGDTWTLILDLLSPQSLPINTCCQSGLLFIDPLNGLITTSFGPDPRPYVSWTHDGGISWERQDLPPPSPAFAAGYCGTVSPVYTPPGPVYLILECQDPGKTSPVPMNYLYATPDLGKHWSILALPEPELQNGNWHYNRRDRMIAFSSSQSGWLFVTDFYESGDGQKQQMFTHLYQTSDGGGTWQPLSTVHWAGTFSFVDRNLGWAIARDFPDQYAFVHTDDGGITWQIIEPEIKP